MNKLHFLRLGPVIVFVAIQQFTSAHAGDVQITEALWDDRGDQLVVQGLNNVGPITWRRRFLRMV